MPTDVIVLGRRLGTSSGWDQVDDWAFTFSDFKPTAGVDVPDCKCLFVALDSGFIAAENEEGATLATGDLVQLCVTLPKHEELL